MTVRYVRYSIDIPGFRTRHIMVATTLSEAPARELAQLYLRRWDIELCFDDIKTTMGMDFIRAKSPAMAVKMLTLYAIAYNLVRLLMQQAVRATGSPTARVHSMRLSFKGALDATLRFAAEMAQAPRKRWHSLREKLFRTIASDSLPRRGQRFEPRVVKRRPKPFPLMTRPRAVLKQQILSRHRYEPYPSAIQLRLAPSRLRSTFAQPEAQLGHSTHRERHTQMKHEQRVRVKGRNMKIEWVSGFAPITQNPEESASLDRDDLGLPLEGREYLSLSSLCSFCCC